MNRQITLNKINKTNMANNLKQKITPWPIGFWGPFADASSQSEIPKSIPARMLLLFF